MSRIALVVPSLAEGGGVPAVARFLCRVLEDSDRYGPRLVSLATSSRDGASVRLLSPKSWSRGVQVRQGSWEGRSYRHVGAQLAEVEFMRYLPRSALTETLEGVDLVQVVAGAPCWAVPVLRSQIPVVLQAATLTRRDRASRLASERALTGAWRRGMTRITEGFDQAGLRRADRVLVENRHMKKAATAVTDPRRVILAPPGVDTERYRPLDGGDGDASGGYIFTVGRFGDPRKNPGLLFEAYARLKGRRASCPPLWLAGTSGPPESAWAVARRHGVGRSIRYLGEVSEEELARLYREATLFVLSSNQEGFGLVVVEAMASGVPVVSTASGGPEEIISDGADGSLVPVGDARALARAMEEMLEAPDRRRAMGRQARKTAVGRYSLEVAGKRYLAVYESLLGGADQRRSEEVTGRQGGAPSQ